VANITEIPPLKKEISHDKELLETVRQTNRQPANILPSPFAEAQ